MYDNQYATIETDRPTPAAQQIYGDVDGLSLGLAGNAFVLVAGFIVLLSLLIEWLFELVEVENIGYSQPICYHK